MYVAGGHKLHGADEGASEKEPGAQGAHAFVDALRPEPGAHTTGTSVGMVVALAPGDAVRAADALAGTDSDAPTVVVGGGDAEREPAPDALAERNAVRDVLAVPLPDARAEADAERDTVRGAVGEGAAVRDALVVPQTDARAVAVKESETVCDAVAERNAVRDELVVPLPDARADDVPGAESVRVPVTEAVLVPSGLADGVGPALMVWRALALVVAVALAEHEGRTPRPETRQPAHGQGTGAPPPAGQ